MGWRRGEEELGGREAEEGREEERRREEGGRWLDLLLLG